MKASSITKSELKEARKAGFKRKKPKKPTGKKSVTSIEGYIDRYNSWVKDAKEKAKEGRKLEVLKKDLSKI